MEKLEISGLETQERNKGNKEMSSDLDNGFIGKCADCGREDVLVRRMEVYGAFDSGKRGFVNICFGCSLPVMYFISPTLGKCEVPMNKEKAEELVKQKTKELLAEKQSGGTDTT